MPTMQKGGRNNSTLIFGVLLLKKMLGGNGDTHISKYKLQCPHKSTYQQMEKQVSTLSQKQANNKETMKQPTFASLLSTMASYKRSNFQG